MRHVQHPSNNTVFGAPPGVDHDECTSLPATRVTYDNGQKAILSYWLPSTEEKIAILAGKPIVLSLWGQTMVPVSLQVEGVEE